ncbi:MAG: cytochrome P450 [Acidimicrobiales bacterium]
MLLAFEAVAVMRREEIALSVLRGLVKRPRLADAVFRFDKWGNILGPDRFVDPYPIYERMRAAGPVSFSPLWQQWAVVGYEEAREVLSSSSFGVAAQLDLLLEARPYSNLSERTKILLRNALLFTDPPLHTRLRSVVNRAFTPRQMQRLEPRIDALARSMVATMATSSKPDAMAALADPLPINVISELIGVPADRWAWMAQISAELRAVLDPFNPIDPADVDATCDDLTAYYSDLADQRLRDPQEDLISELVRAEADDGRLDRSELVSIVTILMLAGHETTSGAIGNAIVTLADHPDQRALVAANPALWPNAVEELLRFDTAVHTDPRAAFEDVTIAGAKIKKGQNLTVMLGAANRDPRRFDDPDELRLDRDDPTPLSFGHGIHHCIGAALARMETRLALRAFLDAFPDYIVDHNTIKWKQSLAFRSPTYLQVQRAGHSSPTTSPATHAFPGVDRE